MTIQVIEVGAGQSENEKLIAITLIRLDMRDCSAIEDGKRLIAEINRSVRRKDLQEDKKKYMKGLRARLKRAMEAMYE